MKKRLFILTTIFFFVFQLIQVDNIAMAEGSTTGDSIKFQSNMFGSASLDRNILSFDFTTKTYVEKIAYSNRFFLNEVFQKNALIKTIKLYTYSLDKSANITIEFWKVENNTYTKVKEKNITNDGILGIHSFAINESFEHDTAISLTSSANIIGYYTGGTSKIIRNKTMGTFTTSSFEAVPFGIMVGIEYENLINTISYTKDNIITVGKGKQYETIQDAIDNANDSENNHVTLLVYPGIYKSFTLTRKRNEPLTFDNVKPRYISIVAIDKFNTIVKEDTGEYPNATEIHTNGIIKNIYFSATHENPVSSPESNRRKSYAMHCDFRGINDASMNLQFEDCIFESYNGPAVGLGVHQDQTIKFKDCQFYSHSTPDYGGLMNHGAFYAHSSTLANKMNMKLIIDNCRIYTDNSMQGSLIVQHLSTGGQFTLTAINNIIVSYANPPFKVSFHNNNGKVILSDESFGNNSANLNK